MKKYGIGIDEAGRGPWAGPVVAGGACFLRKTKDVKLLISKLRDSKLLSEKRRIHLFEEIQKLAKEKKLAFGIGMRDEVFIDTYRIREATKSAMQEALKKLASQIDPLHWKQVRIDGKDHFSFAYEVPVEYIVKGDRLIPEIQVAAILAKVFRDKLMQKYARIYPQFGFEKHKGYGTKLHQEMIQKHGICKIHRTSFRPMILVKTQKK